MQLWTLEEESRLKELIESNTMSTAQMLKFFPGRTQISLYNKTLKMGLKNPYKDRYLYDQEFWRYPNLTNCYFAGFCLADGSVSKKGGCFGLHLELHKRDECLLNRFRDAAKSDKPLYRISRTKEHGLVETIKLDFCAREWEDDLKNNFGLCERKTFRMIPPRLKDKNLIKALIIGYIDGDGTITADYKDRVPCISITSASIRILEWIRQNAIEMGVGQRPNVYKLKNKKAYKYTVSGKHAIVLFEELSKVPVQKLERKWNNPEFLKVIEEFKQR